jgi:hypothetical protein
MIERAPAGWYPDGQGSERYWDGDAWTDQIRVLTVTDVSQKAGAFSKLGAAVKSAAAEKKAAKEELTRRQAEDEIAAGSLVTSGVFGTSTVAIYENGYVRVASWSERVRASWSERASATGPRAIDKNTPYEKLRSIKFKQPKDEASGAPSALEGAVGPAVAKLLKGGKGLMKASVPGMAAAGIAHVASDAARTSFLTIATDRQIHTLTNKTTNSVGLKTSSTAHNDAGRALEVAGNAVLGVVEVDPHPVVDAPVIAAAPEPAGATQTAAAPTLSERLRELADLHHEGILSDEEFASAKAKVLGGL